MSEKVARYTQFIRISSLISALRAYYNQHQTNQANGCACELCKNAKAALAEAIVTDAD
jgi:hypothetical protein